jgi:hypothetical protein
MTDEGGRSQLARSSRPYSACHAGLVGKHTDSGPPNVAPRNCLSPVLRSRYEQRVADARADD